MKRPLEFLESRLEELRAEYQRVLFVNLKEDEADSYFKMHKQKDLDKIDILIEEYTSVIALLTEENLKFISTKNHTK